MEQSYTYIESLEEVVEEEIPEFQSISNSSRGSTVCDKCGKTFTSIYTLANHKKQVHDKIKSFRCEICFAAFATKYKLNRHHAGVHSDDRNFTCTVPNCLNSFKTRDMLKKHERLHFKQPFTCEICDITFKFKSGFDYHWLLKHTQKVKQDSSEKRKFYECQECNEIFKSKKEFERHKDSCKVLNNDFKNQSQNQINLITKNKENSDETFSCLEENCNKKSKTEKDLLRHIKLIHKSKSQTYTCVYCKKEYKNKSVFENHILWHDETEMECEFDNDVIIEEVYEEIDENNCENEKIDENDCEKQEENEKIDENDCEKQEENEKIEYFLENIDENSIQNEENIYILEEKQTTPEVVDVPYEMEAVEDYDDGMDLFEQIIAEDLEPQNETEMNAEDDEFSAPAGKTMKIQRKTENLCICEECGKTFKNNSHLTRHVQRKHRKSDHKMKCNVCGQKFLLNYDLKRHMTKHSDVRNFQCSKCSQKFKTKNCLKKHLKALHSSEKPQKKFPCPHCDRSYFESRHLEFHMRKHNGDQRYRCDVCVPEKTFYYPDAIKWHKIRHHGEPAPFNCETCMKRFIYEKSLKTHEKEHHPETGSLGVTCPVCGKSVSEKRHLKRHLRTHTSNDFNCPCGESFKERHQLTKHKNNCLGTEEDSFIVIKKV